MGNVFNPTTPENWVRPKKKEAPQQFKLYMEKQKGITNGSL